MKHLTYYIILLLAFAMQPAAAQNYVLTSVARDGASSLHLQDNEIVFGTTAATKTVTPKTNLEITPVSDSPWCTVWAEGSKVTVAVTANPGKTERTALLTLKAKDGNTRKMTVRQFGSDPAVYATPTTVTVNDASEFSFEVASSVAPTFTCPGWIAAESPAPAIGTNVYTFKITGELTNAVTRKDSILVSGAGANKVWVKVIQTTEKYPSFAVISDIHVGDDRGDGWKVKIPRALKNLTAKGNLDAIFVVGDLANEGKPEQYEQVVSIFQDKTNYTNPVGRTVFMTGNHDCFTDINNYTNGLRAFNNGELYPYDQYMVIKGYPFITISTRSSASNDDTNASDGTAAYPQAVQDTLRSWLARADKECPGKPIFVFTHVPPKYTCYSSWPGEGAGSEPPTWAMKVLNPILNDYPQAVVFAGHGHYPLGDPRSIHQGVNPKSERQNYFTVINTGSTAYCEIEEPALDEGGYPKGFDNVTEGLVVNVEPAGDVEVHRYDTRLDEEIQPKSKNLWLLKAPFDGSQFQYGDMRDADDNPDNREIYTGLPAPTFPAGAKATVTTEKQTVTVKFPQATNKTVVFRYLVRLVNDKGYAIKNYWAYSGYFKNSEMPDSVTATFTGLEYGKNYTVTVAAYDSYNNASEAIASEPFALSGEMDPADAVPARIGDWTFDDEANPLASSEGTTVLTPGNITTSGEVTMGSDIAGTGISYTTGPTETNKAVRVPGLSIFKIENDGTALPSYTLMYDMRIASIDGYHCLLQTNIDNNEDADFCINRSGELGLRVNDWGYGGNVSLNKWHRVVLTVTEGVPCVYLDGEKVCQGTGVGGERWQIGDKGTYIFCDDDGEDNDIDVAEVALWKEPLSATQVFNLGKIIKGDNISVGTTNFNLLDEKEINVSVSSTVEPAFTCPDWIHLKRPVASIGNYTYVFNVDAMSEIGTRTGEITVSGPEGSTVEPIKITVNQSYSGEKAPDAFAKWTFDDAGSLMSNATESEIIMEPAVIGEGAAVTTVGTLEEAGIKQVEGPTKDNKAITCPAASVLSVMYDAESENDITNYTLMYDIRINNLISYNALLQTNLDNSNDADFTIKGNGNLGLGSDGWSYGGDFHAGRWHRVIMTVKDNMPTAYLDGTLVAPATAANGRWGLPNTGFYLFCDEDGELSDVDVAEIRYWKQPLTAEQVEGLGSVDYPYIVVSPADVNIIDNETQFSVEVKSTVVPKIEKPDWIQSISVTPSTGKQTYTFKADDMTEIGSREGTITLTAADGSEVEAAVITVKQSYNGGKAPLCTGKWTFENEKDLYTTAEGTATLAPCLLGDDGVITAIEDPSTANVYVTDGPADGNKALTLNKGTALKMNLSETATLTNYTIQYDVRAVTIGNTYISFLQTDLNNTTDGRLFINKDGQIGFAVGGLGYHGQMAEGEWNRVTLVVKDGFAYVYQNGKLIGQSTDTGGGSWNMNQAGALLFCDNDGETDTMEIAEVDFWNFPLTASQIEKIGVIDQGTAE